MVLLEFDRGQVVQALMPDAPCRSAGGKLDENAGFFGGCLKAL